MVDKILRSGGHGGERGRHEEIRAGRDQEVLQARLPGFPLEPQVLPLIPPPPPRIASPDLIHRASSAVIFFKSPPLIKMTPSPSPPLWLGDPRLDEPPPLPGPVPQ